MFDDDHLGFDDLTPGAPTAVGERLVPELNEVQIAGAIEVARNTWGAKIADRWPGLIEATYLPRVNDWAALVVWRTARKWFAVQYWNSDTYSSASGSMPANAPAVTELTRQQLLDLCELETDLETELFFRQASAKALARISPGLPRGRRCIRCRQPFLAADAGNTACNPCKAGDH